MRSYRRKTVFSRSRDQCVANWCMNCNYSLGLGFGDGLGLWLSSEHLQLSGDGLGLGFWVTMRAWPVARSIFDAPLGAPLGACYVREANERTTSWIRFWVMVLE